MENFNEELDVGLPHLANIDVTPTLKSIQISTEELRQLFTLELTPEPSIPSVSLAPQQLPSTPQISSATQSSSEVTEPLIVDPTPRSEPQTTAGSSLGGKRRSGREKRPMARKKDMPNQDL
jgi:hypothetical protein